MPRSIFRTYLDGILFDHAPTHKWETCLAVVLSWSERCDRCNDPNKYKSDRDLCMVASIMLFFFVFYATKKLLIMLFFIPLCHAYAPVILPYIGPFMLTLGSYESYLLFVWLPLDLRSFFAVMLAKSPTLSSAVSLNVILIIPIHVCV